MNTSQFVPTLGFALGAWLTIAGVHKLLNRAHFESVLGLLLPSGLRVPLSRTGAIAFPWLEITVGLLAGLLFDFVAVRIAVLALFTAFFAALVSMAWRFERFDCGCFGSGQMEDRTVVLGRGITGLLLAALLFEAPASTPGAGLAGVFWFYCCAWSVLLLGAAALHLRRSTARMGGLE